VNTPGKNYSLEDPKKLLNISGTKFNSDALEMTTSSTSPILAVSMKGHVDTTFLIFSEKKSRYSFIVLEKNQQRASQVPENRFPVRQVTPKFYLG